MGNNEKSQNLIVVLIANPELLKIVLYFSSLSLLTSLKTNIYETDFKRNYQKQTFWLRNKLLQYEGLPFMCPS